MKSNNVYGRTRAAGRKETPPAPAREGREKGEALRGGRRLSRPSARARKGAGPKPGLRTAQKRAQRSAQGGTRASAEKSGIAGNATIHMKSYQSSFARSWFADILKEAEEAPVEITRHGARKRYVLMSAPLFEVYELIRRAHAEGRVIVAAESALGKLLKGEDEAGFLRLRLGNAMLGRLLKATGERL